MINTHIPSYLSLSPPHIPPLSLYLCVSVCMCVCVCVCECKLCAPIFSTLSLYNYVIQRASRAG